MKATAVLFYFMLCVFLLPLGSQTIGDDLDLVPLLISEETTYLSRYNLRVHLDNSYRGLRYVEISGQLERNDGGSYDTSFWHLSETTSDLRTVSAPIDRMREQTLSLDELNYNRQPFSATSPGHLHAFPEYRNFPLLPSAVLYRLTGPGIPAVGSSYEAHAYRLTDPEGDGEFSPVHIYVRYIYRGIGEYLEETVHFFDADFALRSDGRYTDFTVQGSNKVRIVVFPGDDTRIFMNNTIAEHYGLQDRAQMRIEGFGLTWIRSPQPIYDNDSFLAEIAAIPGAEQSSADTGGPSQKTAVPSAALPDELPERISSSGGDIDIGADPLGLKFSLPNIQFAPDSTDLLAGEQERLKILAGILKKAPGRRFIIVGHTADLGRPQGQQELSLARAERIARFFTTAGILPGAMRYEGRGGTEPINDNNTAEGRAANRRVEVIILD